MNLDRLLILITQIRRPVTLSALVIAILYVVYELLLKVLIYEKIDQHQIFLFINQIALYIFIIALVTIILSILSYLMEPMLQSSAGERKGGDTIHTEGDNSPGKVGGDYIVQRSKISKK